MKPTTYHEWRALLHETWKATGAVLSWHWHRKEIDRHYRSRGYNPARRGKLCVLSRDLYKLAHRAYRIEMQMNAEMEAGTTSAMRAMMELLRGEIGKRDDSGTEAT